ncbi:MAG: response regulator [Planctomycetes bacterium]|nr:response regulator [Planctomycetota bacterium]
MSMKPPTSPTSWPHAVGSPAEPVAGLEHRVLLLDDQKLIGEVVRTMLADQSDIVYTSSTHPQEAIELAAAFRPTLILQDLVMPGLDWLEMVRRFRALPTTCNVPIIILSAREEAVVKAHLFEAGANDYLVKLPDPIELIARIRVHSEAYLRLMERDAAFAALETSLADLKHEQEKSEQLLLNILPPQIAQRLKNGQSRIADSFPAATVLFADLCGFTEYSQHVAAPHLVDMLDEIFTAFDHIAADHGVEKIKTIGDAYMAVAGVPQPRADHAEAVAEMALEMLDGFAAVMRGRGMSLEVRIGIHSGSVVAGVIGRHKFIYDLWGDTVNMASRMESHGAPSRVQVSAATQALLEGKFRFFDRGEIVVKGKGKVQTAFLLGRA